MLRGSEGEEEEEEEWEEAEEGVEVEEVEEDEEEEEEELSRELQQLAEMELGETEQVFNSAAAAIFNGDLNVSFSGSSIRSGQNANLAQISGFKTTKASLSGFESAINATDCKKRTHEIQITDPFSVAHPQLSDRQQLPAPVSQDAKAPGNWGHQHHQHHHKQQYHHHQRAAR